MKLTVLMSVFNNAEYLPMAVESILNQSYSDFEFIIINDASTDNTPNILASYKDPRIIIVNNDKNIGLTKSLNKGLRMAKGEYIARMDSDDISLPDRFAEQLSFMTDSKGLYCVGCNNLLIDHNNQEIGKIIWPQGIKENINAIASSLNPVGHPNVIFRKDIVLKIGQYNENYKTCQDIELWFRFYKNGYRTDNVPNFLVKLRKHENQISNNNNERILFPIMFQEFAESFFPYIRFNHALIDRYMQYYVWKETLPGYPMRFLCVLLKEHLKSQILKRLN